MATDYKSWKVVDLKAELKRRDVPQTGLRLKQQLVDRLVELDNNPSTTDHDNDDRNGNDDTTANANTGDASDITEQKQSPQKSPLETEKQKITPEEAAVVDREQTQQQESPAQDNESRPPAEVNTVQETSIDASEEQTTDQPGAPEVPPSEREESEVPQPESKESDDADRNAQQSTTPPHDSASNSLPEQTIEESRKRRRSESVSSTQATTKKAKQSIETTSETPPDVAAPVGQQPEPAPQSPEDAGIQEAEPVRPAGPITKQASPAPAAPVAAAAAAAVEPDRLHAETQQRPVASSVHPSTRSLYICNLMRPVQPAVLKFHLAETATPPGTEPNTGIIENFFLDQIRSHCFVTFSDEASAIRVRSLLHDVVWPNESMRKPLWVDFIPDDKVQEWIETEQGVTPGTGFPRGSGSRRWEVVYNTSGDDVKVYLRSIGGPAQQGGAVVQQPTPVETTRRDPAPDTQPPRQSGQGFKALDDLFKFTAAKPRLYYMPVSRSVANRRLDRFDGLARSSASSAPAEFRGANELRRYTFQDDDRWTCVGPDISPFGGRRGGRGRRGRRGGRFRDSYRGRGQ